MLSPKSLVNLSVFAALVCTALFILLLWSPPYTGFMLEEDPDSGYMKVVSLDDWVADQGLRLGDQIVSVTAANGLSLDLKPKHVLTSTYQARRHYENREERLKEFARVHEIFKQPSVNLKLTREKVIELKLDHPRTLASISPGVWIRFFLSLAAPLFGALVWVWRPKRKETILLLISGVGLLIFTLPSAASIYTTDMFYPAPFLFWFLKLAGGLGSFIYIGFASCLLLYFPRKLNNAVLWTKRLLIGLLVYAIATLLNDWTRGVPVTGQFLYYSYNETYFPMVLYYGFVLRLCYLQWRASEHSPLERAQALWVIFAWIIGPSIFIVFYLLPIAFGEQGLLNRTMNTVVVASSYWLLLVGVAKFQIFQIEQYIGAAYQWSFVSLFFFGLDFMMVYAANVSHGVSTFVVLGLVLWVYLPLRQWFLQRFSQNRQRRYQQLFSDAVVQMVEGSMVTTTQPMSSWKSVLSTLFSPVHIKNLKQSERTTIEQRGEALIVARNRFSEPFQLEYADNGTRLFFSEDRKLVRTLSLLFERLYDFRDAYFSGQTQERERIRRDLHDQIGHKLLSLIYTAKDEDSRRLAQETMSQLRELIQALKDEPVSLQNSLARLKSLSEEACEHAGLTIQWNDMLNQHDCMISSNQHLNILNIMRELLNNTIRHARATCASIKISINEACLEIKVADNGIGFDQESVSAGNGLHNIQSRIQELDAKILWHTSSCTEVTLLIPLSEAKVHHGDP